MSHYIPFDIQSLIMKSLPVKSLIRFRSVSKQWKSLIDNAEFINNYHFNHTNPQHHLLVSYKLDDTVTAYTSSVDNHTFPKQKSSLTAPELLTLLRKTRTLDSVEGLLCFCGFYGVHSKTKMAVIWNPTLRKSVGIAGIPKVGYKRTIVGFGVCPRTSDPKLVKINVSNNKIPSMWEVEVFTLSTRVWKTVYVGAPFKSGVFFTLFQVFLDGVIYFLAKEDEYVDEYLGWSGGSKLIISFDMKSEKFGEVCLPKRLVHALVLDVAKVNGSLGLLEHYDEGETSVCGVWTRKDGANDHFTKIFTLKVESEWYYRGLGFRNNGEVVMELDDGKYNESRIGVYKPLSKHIIDVGINGKQRTMYASSYMETLLLLDEPHSIIH